MRDESTFASRNSGIFDRLVEIRGPVLLIWGQHDRLVPVRHAGEFAKRLRDARVEIAADSGHIHKLSSPRPPLRLCGRS
jgi:pimeloyl-ACP methyl ester carboxylesterase